MLIDNGAVHQAVYVATHCRCSTAVYERVLSAVQQSGGDDQSTRDRLAEGECDTAPHARLFDVTRGCRSRRCCCF
jgi:hypothetical protein